MPYLGSEVACFLVTGFAMVALKSYSLKGFVLGVYTIKVVLFVGQRNSQYVANGFLVIFIWIWMALISCCESGLY